MKYRDARGGGLDPREPAVGPLTYYLIRALTSWIYRRAL
jgi:hypothetical protein